ncbi:MAG: phosphotransferase [Microcella sp.]|nr:MAG: phosphotransferase [Microcella sp.]
MPLWRNDLGGITVRIDPRSARSSLVLKFSPPGREIDLADERARLDWSAAWHPVPRVLDAGEYPTGSGGLAQWLLMSALPGESAVADRWRAEPRTAVRAIGEGLRRLHEALPVAECPFVGPTLETDQSIDVLVVAHGDACAPNTLLDGEGRFLAHVDLGALGVADRWSDLAIASMSLEWNFGGGWEAEFFAAYGVAPDGERIHAWRERWAGSEPPAVD